MADLVRSQNDLPTIKLNVAFESVGTSMPPVWTVQIEIGRGNIVFASLTARPEDLGVPDGFDPAGYRYYEPGFSISTALGSQIGEAAQNALGGDLVLWLQLTEPIGFLSALPLEEMLRPFVGSSPIVRIPNFALIPTPPSEPHTIVVCMSEARAKIPFNGSEILRELIPSLLDSASNDVIVHLFTDVTAYYNLAGGPAFGRFAASHLVVHDPLQAPAERRSLTRAETSFAVTNPWLLWMLDELTEVKVDVVHFITHGYTHSGQSALALAESPTQNQDTLWARFVGPNEISAWLGHLGAWAVGFTSPPHNFSTVGLRAFYNDVARLRAGPVLLHTLGLDLYSQPAEVAEATRAYSALLGGGPPELLRSISMYAHPALLSGDVNVAVPESFADALVSYSLGRSPGRAASTPSTPVWVTSTSRYLEQSVATMFPAQSEPTSTTEQAAGLGAERALRYVNEVLGRLGESS